MIGCQKSLDIDVEELVDRLEPFVTKLVWLQSGQLMGKTPLVADKLVPHRDFVRAMNTQDCK